MPNDRKDDTNKQLYFSGIANLKTPENITPKKVIGFRRYSPLKYKDRVDYSVKYMEDNYPQYTDRLKENIGTLKIRKLPNKKNLDRNGYYNPRTNTIFLYEDEPLEHELLHMASSIVVYTFRPHKNEYCGFMDYILGTGINEGFTQYLAESWFGTDKTYQSQVDVTKKIIYIIGFDRMLSLYFTRGLKDLYEELRKYDYLDEYKTVSELIRNMDYINIPNCTSKDKYLLSIYDNIVYFYAGKLYNEVQDGKNMEQALLDFDSFINSLFTPGSELTIDETRFIDFESFKNDLLIKTESIKKVLSKQLRIDKKTLIKKQV